MSESIRRFCYFKLGDWWQGIRCHTDTRVFSAQLVAYGEAVNVLEESTELLRIMIECRIELAVEVQSKSSRSCCSF